MATRFSKKEWENIRKGTGDYTVEGDAEDVVRDKQVEDEQSSLPGYVSKGEDKWAKEWRKENERQKVASDKTYKKKKRAIKRGKEYGEFKDEKSAKKLADKLSKESPKHRFSVHAEMSDYGITKYVIGKRGMTNEERKAESSKRKADRARQTRHNKMVRERVADQAKAAEWRSRGVPEYRPVDLNFGKSKYAPMQYKPVEGVKQYRGVSGEPYYKPSNVQGKPYEPISDAPYVKPSSTGGVMSQGKPYEPIFGNKVPMPKASKPKKSTKGRISPITGFRTF